MKKESNLWPTINSVEKARIVAREQGFWGSIIVASFTAISLVFLPDETYSPLEDWTFVIGAIVNVGLYIAFAFGIRRMSRVAATSAFLLYLADRIYMIFDDQSVGFFGLISMYLVMFFLNSVRATFAFHRFSAKSN